MNVNSETHFTKSIKSLKKMSQKLYFLDILKSPTSLQIDGNEKKSTFFSQFFSLGIIGFLFYNIIQSDLVQKTNPIQINQTLEPSFRPQSNLTREMMTLAFALVDGFDNRVYELDPTIFTYTVNNTFITNTPNGSIYNRVNMPIERCTSDDLSKFPEKVEELNMKGAFCMSGNWEIELKGYFDEKILNYLQIFLLKCVNSTSSKVICKSPEEIDKFFNYKIFRVYIEQKSIDLNNYTTPIQGKMKTYFGGIEIGKMKVKRLFIRKATVDVDRGWISNQNEKIITYTHGKTEDDDAFDPYRLFLFLLYASEEEQNFAIRYQKLPDLLAQLGGILSTLIAIFAIFVKIHYQYLLDRNLLSHTYFFIPDSQNSENQKKNIKLEANENFSEEPVIPEEKIEIKTREAEKLNKMHVAIKIEKATTEQNELISNEKTSTVRPLKKIDFEFKTMNTINTSSKENAKGSMKKEKKTLKLSFFDYIKLKIKGLIFKNHSLTDQEQMLNHCINTSQKQLDLMDLIERMKDVEKLKMVFLNEEQRVIFDSLKNKSVKTASECFNRNDLKFILSEENLDENDREQIQKYLNSIDESSSDVDKRLYQIIEKRR